jgi:hypothetical protein
MVIVEWEVVVERRSLEIIVCHRSALAREVSAENTALVIVPVPEELGSGPLVFMKGGCCWNVGGDDWENPSPGKSIPVASSFWQGEWMPRAKSSPVTFSRGSAGEGPSRGGRSLIMDAKAL